MSWFKRGLLIIGALLIILALVGLMLPRHVHVERSVTIARPAQAVFAQVNGFAQFNKWSPWVDLDPAAKYTYEGPAEGVGATMKWVGDPGTIGTGSQRITASRPYDRVETLVDFGTQGAAVCTFTLVPEGGSTRTTWAFDIDLGVNPVSRYFGLMFDGMIGRDWEKGLSRLKKYTESLPAF
jgi:carbon monoxide dehydrogenase subunit G